MAQTFPKMEERKYPLTNYAMLVKEVEALGLRSCKELKDFVAHHFGFCKHEFYAYRSLPSRFIIIFSEHRARDLVFAIGRIIDGPVELMFEAWDVDALGDRTIIPFHVKLSLEAIPQHAWSQEIAEKVLCDEAIIHHVKGCTRLKTDQHCYPCWAFSKDPSKIPQVVFLTLASNEKEFYSDAQVHFVRPRGVKQAHVFKVLVHLDVVKDLYFYHFPREELLVDEKVGMVARMGSLTMMTSSHMLHPMGQTSDRGGIAMMLMMMKTMNRKYHGPQASFNGSCTGWTIEEKAGVALQSVAIIVAGTRVRVLLEGVGGT
jgi:hypothetical protein